MNRRVFLFTETAKSQLRGIPQKDALEILRKLDRFELTGVGDVRRLVNISPPELRLRHGNYRVRFHATTEEITILSVTNRDRSYR